MNIKITRGKVVSFAELSPKSVALDGYVQGPAIDVEMERYSFDHHDGCIRLITRATCEQVRDALLLGLDPSDLTIFLNDLDGDTVLAVWLLLNYTRAKEKLVREIVDTVGAIDAHGPAFPAVDQNLADAFFQGVMKPVFDLQRVKQYGEANLDTLLATCIDNIDKLVSGTLEWAPRSEKERTFAITHSGNGWVMARSDDFIFDLLYENGHTRAIAYQELPDRSIAYTVGKKSELVSDFPVGPQSKPRSILFLLNQHEPGWGGGSTIGGAPRHDDGSRSRLTPDEVFAIVKQAVPDPEGESS